MAHKGQVSIQNSIETEEEYEAFLATHFNHLICMEVYSDFCGPCLAAQNAIRKGKLEIGQDRIAMVKALADKFEPLSRFKNKSEPLFLFIFRGKLTRLMFGSNGIELCRIMEEEMSLMQKEIDTGLVRYKHEINEMLSEEARKLEVDLKIEEESREATERLRVLTLAARKRRVCQRLSRHTKHLNFILFWPHCHKAHYDLYEKCDMINISVGAKETMELTEEGVREALYMSDVDPNEACIHALMKGEALIVLFKMMDTDPRDFFRLLRYALYEEIPVPKEDVPPEKQVPPIPAYERYASISKTAREVRRDRYEAKLQKLREEKEERDRLAAEQARLARQAEEERLAAEKQRQEEERMARIQAGEPISLNRVLGPPHVLYTPATTFTRVLMSLVGRKLDLLPLTTLPDRRSDWNVRGYAPFSNASSILRYIPEMDLDEAIVEFHNMSEGALPDRLNYSIKMKPGDSMSTFDEPYGLLYDEQFLALQWAIESSFIQMLTGKKVNQDVTLQEIPPADSHIKLLIKTIKLAFTIYLTCSFTMMSIFYVFMSTLLFERASGMQELMKMMGVTPGALVLSHVLNACIPGLVYAIFASMFLTLGPRPLIGKTSGFFIFLTFLFHFLSLISYGIVGSYIGSKASNNAVTVLLVYFLGTVPAFVVYVSFLSGTAIYFTGFLFVVPLNWCLFEIAVLEYFGDGLNCETMMEPHLKNTSSVFVAYIYFIIQIALCALLSWYLERVTCGMYGTALPWNFLCKKEYWRKNSVTPQLSTTALMKNQDQRYFESTEGQREAGIRVINVTKDFPGNPGALKNVSLDVYKNEITVLLGHNGAGKSTLISIITGMTEASKGRVLVNGMDIMTQKVQARKNIGLCPQQNMFLSNLSVQQHVMFFTLLKRGSMREAEKSSLELLGQVYMKDKANNATSELSGGMKRRVQLACALAGNASVLLLDEPTSGLDVQTRRSLWDMLLALRGSRTVLLSTHFMEEADALGDRVAALSAGKLKCHATPMYLKRAIGAGYRMSLTTTDKPDETAITDAVKSVIPGASVTEVGYNSIAYNLPLENTKDFPTLFSNIESKKEKLGIESIGVGVSTLEEVFIQLCSSTKKKDDDVATRIAPRYKINTGAALCCRQIVVLIKRYFVFLWRYKWSQIVFGMLFVMTFILVTTYFTNNKEKKEESLRATELDILSTSSDPRVLLKLKGIDLNLKIFNKKYPGVHFENVTDVNKATLLDGDSNEQKNSSNYLAAIEVNNTHAQVLYSDPTGHGAGAALNLLSNLIASEVQPAAGGRAITVYDEPLQNQNDSSKQPFKKPKDEELRNRWTYFIIILIILGVMSLMMMPCKEYATSARLNHLLAGCLCELHWTVTLILAGLQVLCTYVVVIVIACYTLDFDKTFSNGAFILAVSTVVLLSCLAMIIFMATICFHSSLTFTMTANTVITFVTLVIFPRILDWKHNDYVETCFKIFFPHFAFRCAMLHCVEAAELNALCNLNKHNCPLTKHLSWRFADDNCCGSDSDPVSYFSFEMAGTEVLILFMQIVIWMILVFRRQRGLCSLAWERMTNCRYSKPKPLYGNDIIKTEQNYVKDTVALPPKDIPDIMLVSDVHKNYRSYHLFRTFNAVKGVSLSVKKGECFGLLGMNGAGKTTMFSMMTVYPSATRGRFFANGHFLKIPCVDKYMKSLSYCPQFWGVSDFLTGRQNLRLLLSLKGLSERDADAEAMAWIKLVDMEQYADQLVTKYSGGCLRRIAAVAALCTGAPVTLMDEPTAGVDVAARRSVWAAIKRAMRERRAIVITSHSLDEMETLCHRIAIMAGGEVCALGSPAALRAAYAVGHTVIFKLKHFPEKDEESKQKVVELKDTIEHKFNCTRKDDRTTMLHYHINETMPYSKLFQDMEEIQASSSGLVEDYSVSETTLEEVFISLAKAHDERIQKQKDEEEAKKNDRLSAVKQKNRGINERKNDKKDDGNPGSASDGTNTEPGTSEGTQTSKAKG